MDAVRYTKLSKTLRAIIDGKVNLTPSNSLLFLEAIWSAPDVANCASLLISSEKGLASLQASMRFDTSVSFLNSGATALLVSLQPLSIISGGSFMHPIILAIAEPPIFWAEMVKAFQLSKLTPAAQKSFAWLLLQLCQLPEGQALSQRELASNSSIIQLLLDSPDGAVKAIAQKIRDVLSPASASISTSSTETGPGGRHDNDFVDFKKISTLPTAGELTCAEPSFLRLATFLEDPAEGAAKLATHLDNQSRLLREDMLHELKEEIQIALKQKKGKHRGFEITGLTLKGIFNSTDNPNGDGRNCIWGLQMQCTHDLYFFKGLKPAERIKYLSTHKFVLKHSSTACLFVNGKVVAFPSINRVEDLLAKPRPIIVLQFDDTTSEVVSNVLLLLAQANPQNVKLLQINTAIFAYAPVLAALREFKELNLPELLDWKNGDHIPTPPEVPLPLIAQLKAHSQSDLRSILAPGHSSSIILDSAQHSALISGLIQRTSIIQGPPGTGKSFIGALLAKILHDHTSHKILVVCYTNHALDQFLEDIMNIGVPKSSVVRLGKAGLATNDVSLYSLARNSGYRRDRDIWTEIDQLKKRVQNLSSRLISSFSQYLSVRLRPADILQHLQFDHQEFYEAFRIPLSKDQDGMQRVGKKGKVIAADDLLKRWQLGNDAGMFKNAQNVKNASKIWTMPAPARKHLVSTWENEIRKDLVDEIANIGKQYNQCIIDLESKFKTGEALVLKTRRIIGCTTTAAAKYRNEINAACHDVLLVEEAGEILESHILTALGPKTKQLILIGDHKQLRPKYNDYALSVEKGEGYDFNRSLFERLVLKGFPHITLQKQHRMRPEISKFVRQLTYPDLVDAPTTEGRPNTRGLRDNMIFIDHDHPEDEDDHILDRRDPTTKSSKQNKFEVQMILKIVKYLGQQGYGTKDLVILTPYLGQLRALHDALMKDNDPVLNDLDTHDLVAAGLMSPASAKVSKGQIRLATIDNYQGEECDIVIASLTRSNTSHDIGFMSAPERVNVLFSRARNAFIVIGNSTNFRKSKKGAVVWEEIFHILNSHNHLYTGLPVTCERHPGHDALLAKPDDFDNLCPDGGCKEDCGALLSCTVHKCPSKCHNLVDHSKMSCETIVSIPCPQGHSLAWKCNNPKPVACHKCDREKKAAEKRKRDAHAKQEQRDEEERAHLREIDTMNAAINQENETHRATQRAAERKHALALKQQELDEARARSSGIPAMVSAPCADTSTPHSSAAPGTPKRTVNAKRRTPAQQRTSNAREIWEHAKATYGESNADMDTLMALTGLEEVKTQILDITNKVEVAKRQGTSLSRERFSVSMLGNPGTGKTTVARLYAKILVSLDILPGSESFETTGSRLANDGIPAIKKELERIVEAGGGTVFIDEAYQLTNGHTPGGRAVLEFLLAEIENLVGKVVFMFAGYDREMESFFEHNPGLPSRIPYTLKFKDYVDDDLLDLLEQQIHRKYNGAMRVEAPEGDGIRGLYGRVAIKRLGRGRGTRAFGNARSVENLLATITGRQAARLALEKRQGIRPDVYVFTQEDIVGPDPETVVVESAALKKLNSLIGLVDVKETVKTLFDMVIDNYKLELAEKEPRQISLNRVFLGSPGTGKTTVAKLYGQILSDLGLLSKGHEVVLKQPADFIGSVIGASESQTKAILQSTVGKVLIIDEAYALYGGGSGSDTYKTAVIDTIVAEVQSVIGEDRCVLLLGYREQMLEMFQNVNPGLSRRFAIEDAFQFNDYSDQELAQALQLKMTSQDLTATDHAKKVAIDVLARARMRPNFGNIGDVENLLSKAKMHLRNRQSKLEPSQRSLDAALEPEDFDHDYNRSQNAEANLKVLFEGVAGSESIVSKLGVWQIMAIAAGERGKNPADDVPTNFVFKGPPGTGKTTTARKMGQVYYDMGMLSSKEVIECSASDLVGQYVGQTGPKTQKVLERALGRVLFVDEAYRLGEGHFAQEAMDEIVGLLTQDKYRGKLIVILAGYDADMNKLLSANSGLSSRFPEEIIFSHIPPHQCLRILEKKLGDRDIALPELDQPSSEVYGMLVTLLQSLSQLPSWGNARDMETLARQMLPIAYKNRTSTGGLCISGGEAISIVSEMLRMRQERIVNLPYPALHHTDIPSLPTMMPLPHQTPRFSAASDNAHAAPSPAQEPEETMCKSETRDPGVDDSTWAQLALDKKRAEQEVIQRQEEVLRVEREAKEEIERAQEEAAAAKASLASSHNPSEDARLRELARLAEMKEREEAHKILKIREAQEQLRKEEARIQRKLRDIGQCVAGFRWIKQDSGYRCAGGAHFVSDAQLGI